MGKMKLIGNAVDHEPHTTEHRPAAADARRAHGRNSRDAGLRCGIVDSALKERSRRLKLERCRGVIAGAALQSCITPIFRVFSHAPSEFIALSHDHHHGLALALRCRKQALGPIQAHGRRGIARTRPRSSWIFMRANLVAHFRAEEEVLFPLMHDTSGRQRNDDRRIDQATTNEIRQRDAAA